MAELDDLRDISLHLQHRLGPLLGLRAPPPLETSLDPKTQSLVCLAVLHALDTSDASYQMYVTRALSAGCSPTELVGTLIAVGALVGEAKAVSCARPLALALGYDVEHALEYDVYGHRHGRAGDCRDSRFPAAE